MKLIFFWTAFISMMCPTVLIADVLLNAGPLREEIIEYEHRFDAGGSLELSNTTGRISITGWDKETIYVRATKKAPEKLLDTAAIDAHFTDTSALIKTISHTAPSYTYTYTFLFFTYTYAQTCSEGCVSIDYSIKVPRRTYLKLIESENSAMRIKNIDHSVTIKNGKGDIKTDEIGGPLCIRVDSGDIRITDSKDTVTVCVANGSVKATNIMNNVIIEAKNGDIDIHNIQGAVNIKTKHSDVKGTHLAQSATISVRQGDVYLTNVKGPLSIQSKRGYVKVNKAESSCKIQTVHGDITLAQKSIQPKDSIDLQSTYGDIRLFVVNHIDAYVKADTESGFISFDRSLTDAYHQAENIRNLEIYLGKKDNANSHISVKNGEGNIKIATY
jgi:hypothetical protein